MDVATTFAGLLTSLNEMVEQRLHEMVRDVEEKHFAWLDEILVEAKERFCCGEPELLPRTPSAKNRQKKRKSVLMKDPRKCSWGHGRRSIARRSLHKTQPYPALVNLTESETAAPLVKADPPAISPGKPLVAVVTKTRSYKIKLLGPQEEEKLVLQSNGSGGNCDLETQANVTEVKPDDGNVCRSLAMEFTTMTASPVPDHTEKANPVPKSPQVKKAEVKEDEKPHCALTRLQKKKEQSLKAKVLQSASMRSTRRNPGATRSKEITNPTKAPLTSTQSSPAVMSTTSATVCPSTPISSKSLTGKETGNNADAIQVSRHSLKRTLLMGLNSTPIHSPPSKKLHAIPSIALKRAVTFAEIGPRSFVSQICNVFSPRKALLSGRLATPKAIAKPDSVRKADNKMAQESERHVLAEQLRKKQEIIDEERKCKIEETKKKKLEEMRKKREERQQKARNKLEEQELKKKKKAEEEEERLRKANEAKKLIKTPLPLPRAVKVTLNPAPKMLPNESVKVVDSPQTYDMTPQSVPPPKLPPITGDDYGLDLESEDSTDDECSPKKAIPLWATGGYLARNLDEQYVAPPNLDTLFGDIEVPDLEVIFNKRKQRYVSRTSSANWNSPPLKNTRLGILGH